MNPPLRLGFALLGCTGVALVAWSLRSDAARAAEPAIAAVTATSRAIGEHDFGLLAGHQLAEHEFALENAGSETWTLQRTYGECGCVRAIDCSAVVAPGQPLRLRVRIDTHGQPPGPLSKRVYAVVEPGPQLLVATVLAHVEGSPRVEPVRLDAVLPEQLTEYAVPGTLHLPPGVATSQVGVFDLPDGIRVSFGERSAGAGLDALPFSVSGALSERESQTHFEFRMLVGTSVERQQVSLPVRVRVARRPAWFAAPSAIVLVDGPSEGVSAIHVRTPQGEPVAGVEFTIDPPNAVTAEWRAERSRLEWRLAALKAGESCAIVLSTPDGGRQEIPLRRLAATKHDSGY